MGIRVEHSPSPLTVGYAAMYAGQGQRAERDLRAKQDMMKQARADAAAQARQDSQNAFAEKMSGIQFERSKEMDQINFNQDLTKDVQDFEQSLEFNYGEQAIAAKKTIAEQEHQYKLQLQTHELTEKEKIDNGRIQERIGWVEDQVRNGTWTDEEGAQAIAQLQGIRKPPKIPKTTIQDVIKERVYQDPATGGWWVMDENGTPKYQMPPKGDTIGDYAKMTSEAYKALTKMGEDGSEIPPSYEQVQAYVQNIIRLKNALSGGQPNGAPHDAQMREAPGGGAEQVLEGLKKFLPPGMIERFTGQNRPEEWKGFQPQGIGPGQAQGIGNTWLMDPNAPPSPMTNFPMTEPATPGDITNFSASQVMEAIGDKKVSPQMIQFLQAKGVQAIVQNEQDYEALPIGTKYVGPDGRIYTKTR